VFDHEQTKVLFPGNQELIDVDVGIAPLLVAIWDAGIITWNSCEENEPGIIWIEFSTIKDVERFLKIQIHTLGNRVHKHPDFNDWFCYRILGYEGDHLGPWRYNAHPNVYSITSNQSSMYSRNASDCSVEMSVSVRFPREDYPVIIDLISNYLKRGEDNFKELSDDQWDQVKHYLPPQPLRGRKRSDDRRTLNGILYVLQTDCSWRNIPRRYGSYETVHRRLRQWSGEGVLDAILGEVNQNITCKERLSKYLNNNPNPLETPMDKRMRGEIPTLKGEMAPVSISR
jgi:hypothetical protein